MMDKVWLDQKFCPRTHKEVVTGGDVTHTEEETLQSGRRDWSDAATDQGMPAVKEGCKSSPVTLCAPDKNCVQKTC